jgi:hypothetical protein
MVKQGEDSSSGLMAIKPLLSISLTKALLLLKKRNVSSKRINSPNNRWQLQDMLLGDSGMNTLS